MKTRTPRGFTVVEIMIAVVTIGLLASLAVPLLAKAFKNALAVRVVNDFKVVGDHFNLLIMQNPALPTGVYNENGDGTVPEGFDPEELPLRIFNHPIHQDTAYSFDLRSSLVAYNQGGVVLSPMNGYKIDLKLLRLIDGRLDDGNLATGNVTLNGEQLVYVSYHE
ncbi:MAG: prepilin-type N-terminal cleavage/methylation domain-containing protein [Verrucomicrobiota bacterium]